MKILLVIVVGVVFLTSLVVLAAFIRSSQISQAEEAVENTHKNGADNATDDAVECSAAGSTTEIPGRGQQRPRRDILFTVLLCISISLATGHGSWHRSV